MKLTEKRKRRLSYVLFTFMIICITPLCEKGRILSGASNTNTFTGEELTCVIDLGDDMYGSHGLKTGFSYELLDKFAKDNRCSINVVISGRNENYRDSLLNGDIDILISSWNDSLTNGKGNIRQLDDHTAWSVNPDESKKARTLDVWISHIKGSQEYDEIKSRYYRSFNPHKLAAKGIKVSDVSPYDRYIKEYAKDLGWDWRMLAAVIYQESKYSLNSVSGRGAVGLMQVMPQTGRYYGVENLSDPENNIKVGTRHLKRLQKQFNKIGMSHDELIKFTLAAYNAGEGRIADCRNFAASRNEDSNNWSTIVSLIPLMREDSILDDESVKLGKFYGYETIAYVENIMSLYDAICAIHLSI